MPYSAIGRDATDMINKYSPSRTQDMGMVELRCFLDCRFREYCMSLSLYNYHDFAVNMQTNYGRTHG